MPALSTNRTQKPAPTQNSDEKTSLTQSRDFDVTAAQDQMLADLVSAQAEDLDLSDAQKTLLVDRTEDLKLLTNSNIVQKAVKTMNDNKGTSVEQLSAILSEGDPNDVQRVVDAFKRVHDTLDTILDEQLGVSVSEALRFKSALMKAASLRSIDVTVKPPGPFDGTPSLFVTSLASKMPTGLGFDSRDVLGPGFTKDLQREVEEGDLTQDTADAISIVYSSRLLSALGIAALSEKDMKETHMLKVIDTTQPTDAELAQTVWALETLQKIADQELESVETPGITSSEMIALRAAVYAFESNENKPVLTPEIDVTTQTEPKNTTVQENGTSNSSFPLGSLEAPRTVNNQLNEQEVGTTEANDQTKELPDAYPLWAQFLIALAVLIIVAAIIFGLVKIFSNSSGDSKIPQQTVGYVTLQQQQQQQQQPIVQR